MTTRTTKARDGSRVRRRVQVAAVVLLAAACAPSPSPPKPVISGSTEVGATLTVTNGGWLNEPTTYTYRWESCSDAASGCAAVGGDQSTYELVAGDVGRFIRASVAATNGAGSNRAYADAVGPVTGGSVPVDCTLRGPGVDLHGCDLSEQNLGEIDLSGADLSGANVSGAYLSGTNLSSARAVGTNFYLADMGGADLSGADLTDANLEYADLTTADLTDAVAVRASFFLANAIGASMAGVDLTDADLTEADLTDADLAAARSCNTICPNGDGRECARCLQLRGMDR